MFSSQVELATELHMLLVWRSRLVRFTIDDEVNTFNRGRAVRFESELRHLADGHDFAHPMATGLGDKADLVRSAKCAPRLHCPKDRFAGWACRVPPSSCRESSRHSPAKALGLAAFTNIPFYPRKATPWGSFGAGWAGRLFGHLGRGMSLNPGGGDEMESGNV